MSTTDQRFTDRPFGEAFSLEETNLANRDSIREFAADLARSCGDDRCTDVVVLDLRGISPMADYFVIATGTSDRQIRAVADHLVDLGAEQDRRPLGVDGREHAHWILVDFVDVVAHVFAPEFRKIYDLELLWGDAPHVRWERRTT